VNPVSFSRVRGDPQGFCEWVASTADVEGVAMKVVLSTPVMVVFEAEFDEPADSNLAGYPVELVRISIFADQQVVAVPIASHERTWRHRYPVDLTLVGRSWQSALGGLCLWYPKDPPHLRWQWIDGFDAYVRIVQRHLWYEEYFRRNGAWPMEEAPHGEPPDGKVHLILTRELKASA
jgi:hypothetical protein